MAGDRLLSPAFTQIDLRSDLNLDDGIGVLVTPPEIFTLLGGFHFPKLAIVTVPLAEVNAVSRIFLAVPCMLVVAIPIVVTLVMMVVRVCCSGTNPSRAGEN